VASAIVPPQMTTSEVTIESLKQGVEVRDVPGEHKKPTTAAITGCGGSDTLSQCARDWRIPSFIPTNRPELSWLFACTGPKPPAQRPVTLLDTLQRAYLAEPRL